MKKKKMEREKKTDDKTVSIYRSRIFNQQHLHGAQEISCHSMCNSCHEISHIM